ncbi:DEAD/DEAH box helicase, partial [Photobacterium aquimaris]
FWKTISRYRVLCVFDEIHHCGGNEDSDNNSWGQTLVHDIQHTALYTLALTGTPWRSDELPISLLSYTDPEGKVICNYQYSLKQAVNDGVCRRPNITLIDSDNISLQSNTKPEYFSSINALIEKSNTHYSCVLNNDDALNTIIELAVNKLEAIRQISIETGGLIVAASIIHAQKIIQILEQQFDQTCVLVTYKDKYSNRIIESFKHSDTQWIVSIGMISEGTDIPRLQVCCHLSNIRTELYFRQVLGRILRTTNTANQEAWLYTFAESNLVQFAEQIEIDIPESCSRITMFNNNDYSEHDKKHSQKLASHLTDNKAKDHCCTVDWESSENTFISKSLDIQTQHSELTLGKYHTRIISAFIYG